MKKLTALVAGVVLALTIAAPAAAGSWTFQRGAPGPIPDETGIRWCVVAWLMGQPCK